MHANVYIDPTDAAIDHDLARQHFTDHLHRLTMGGPLLAIVVAIRPDARFIGRRPLLVLDGGALTGEVAED